MSRFSAQMTLSDSGFLFDHSSGQTFTLNQTGQFLFRLLEVGEEDKSLEKLIAEFEVDETTARKDIDDFYRQLKQMGIVA